MLRPIGHVTSADASGVLPRIGAPPSGHWARLASKVSAQLQQHYGSKLFAIALRGSTARGTAVAGVSDLDLIVLLNHSATDIPSGSLLRGHRVKVDLAQSTYPEFMTQPKWAWMRFSLAFFGSVISGPDFISTLPDPTLKPHCIAHLKACDRWIAAWEPMFKATAQPEQKKAICQWLMKRMVRSLFEAVMVDLNCYSRDIYPCAKIAAQQFAPQKATIWRAAELAVAPTDQPAAIFAVLDGLSPLLRRLQNHFPRSRQSL